VRLPLLGPSALASTSALDADATRAVRVPAALLPRAVIRTAEWSVRVVERHAARLRFGRAQFAAMMASGKTGGTELPTSRVCAFFVSLAGASKPSAVFSVTRSISYDAGNP
jgi:hypothetical protein